MGAENPVSSAAVLLGGPAALGFLPSTMQYEGAEKQKKKDEAIAAASKAGADRLIDEAKTREARDEAVRTRNVERAKVRASRVGPLRTPNVTSTGLGSGTILGGQNKAIGA